MLLVLGAASNQQLATGHLHKAGIAAATTLKGTNNYAQTPYQAAVLCYLIVPRLIVTSVIYVSILTITDLISFKALPQIARVTRFLPWMP